MLGDQGPEFKGVVKTVCETLHVHKIKGSAYSLQTQGKDERSHRTWKEKIKVDLINNNNNGHLNWVESLKQYQQLYNESPQLSPFEVYFGRKPNRYRNKLFLVGKKEYEVPDENSNGIEIDECKTEEPTELVTERNSIMQKALDASNKASQNMVKRELWRNPPSLYYKGETVLMRVPVSKKLVKGKKNSLKNTCEGVILEANHSMHKYFISYNDPVTLESETRWFKVDDITSVTKEEENEWQQKAKSDSGRRNDTCTDHEADSQANQRSEQEQTTPVCQRPASIRYSP